MKLVIMFTYSLFSLLACRFMLAAGYPVVAITAAMVLGQVYQILLNRLMKSEQ